MKSVKSEWALRRQVTKYTWFVIVIVALMMCAVVVLAIGYSPVYAQKSCGIERQDVKTLADMDGQIAMNAPVRDATVTELVRIASPDRKTLEKAQTNRFKEEMVKYRLHVVVLGFKRETDSDFHIVIADQTNHLITMIAEIPSDDCVPSQYRDKFAALQSRFASEFGTPTAKFKKLKKPINLVVTGIFFFDYIHGQTGVALNGAELHPLLDWAAD